MAAAAAERKLSWYLTKQEIWWNQELVSNDTYRLLKEYCLPAQLHRPPVAGVQRHVQRLLG